jgi:hypothetical protein
MVGCILAAAAFFCSWWILEGEFGIDRGDALALAGVVMAIALFVAQFWAIHDGRREPVNLENIADQLAISLQRQWTDEEDRRKIHDPIPLPVRWEVAADHLRDDLANVMVTPVGSALEGTKFGGRIEDIAGEYREVRSGRLVILGKAGSGKTVMASRLLLDLLRTREPTGPVPVIFSIGSWNPATPLRQWLAVRLALDHPGLAHRPDRRGPNLASSLIDSDRILPILDGFDEIPAGLQLEALGALNALASMALVLTSRVDEYAAAVNTSHAVLTRALVVQLTDLTVEDIVDYLPRTGRSGERPLFTPWEPVVQRLRTACSGADHAAAVLCAVLATPLMVFLARTIYSDTPGRDPTELLDRASSSDEQAIERHLLAAFVPAIYQQPSPDRQVWKASHARSWLAFLAGHMHRLGTRDLAWWRLGDGNAAIRTLAVALTLGLANGLADGLADGLVIGLAAGLWIVLAVVFAARLRGRLAEKPVLRVAVSLTAGLVLGAATGLAGGLAAGLAGRLAVAAAAGAAGGLAVERAGGFEGTPTPTRAQLQPRRLALGLAVGLGVGLVSGLGVGLAGGRAFGLAVGLAFGLAFGLVAGLEGRLDLTKTVRVRDSLAADRALSLVGKALPVGLAFGVAVWLVFGPAFAVAWLVLPLPVGLATTAWGQWLFARCWLALTGRLPASLLRFLDDAHRRGALREVGAVYQFRHARLQDYLAGASTDPQIVSPPRPTQRPPADELSSSEH